MWLFYHVLEAIGNAPLVLTKKELTPVEITRFVRKQIKETSIKFRTRRSYIADADQILVGGTYDEDQDPCIQIDLIYHPQVTEYTLIDWHTLAADLAECIGHELVHQQQGRRRYRSYASSNKEQAYLGAGHEIEAYGFSVAADLVSRHGGNYQARDQVFMYNVYKDTFSQDQSILLELDRHISKYLEQLKAEPYVKNTNHS